VPGSKPTNQYQYQCHWDYVPGPHRLGESHRTMMFICEYPYRTMRTTGPCEDCRTCASKPLEAQPAGKAAFINWITG
jgi:hypothetical protein